MAYRKFKKQVRGNKPKKRNWIKTGKDALSLAYTAYRGVNLLKSLVNAEKHLFDTVNNTVITNAGLIYPISGMPQGTDTDQRLGNSILGKYISGRLNMQESGATGGIDSSLRLIVFQDTQNQGGTPALSDILASTSDPIISGMNIDFVQRFWVLVDKVYSFDEYNRVKNAKFFRRIKFHLKYTGPLAVNHDQNTIFVCLVSDEPTDGPEVGIYTRLAYHDN